MRENHQWIEKMNILANFDPWHRECQEELEKREPAYLCIKEKLSESEREQLELYIAACEEFNYSFIYPAYELGKRHRRLMR